MSKKEGGILDVFGYLKHMSESYGAGRAYIDFTCEDGSVFRIEYKPKKGGSKHEI